MNLFFWRKEKQQPQAKYGASYRRVGDIMRVDEAFDDLGSPTGAPPKTPSGQYARRWAPRYHNKQEVAWIKNITSCGCFILQMSNMLQGI